MIPWDFLKSFEILTRPIERYLLLPLFHVVKTKLCVQAQSDLILPASLLLSSLPTYTQEITGFFIIESHVLENTGTFRSWRNIEELWDVVISRLTTGINSALRSEGDSEVYLRVKESLLTFTMALEVMIFNRFFVFVPSDHFQASAYSTTPLQDFILSLFERYVKSLETHFCKRLEEVRLKYVYASSRCSF